MTCCVSIMSYTLYKIVSTQLNREIIIVNIIAVEYTLVLMSRREQLICAHMHCEPS